MALSWDGGSNITAVKSTSVLTNTDTVYTLGSPTDDWGHAWTVAQFANVVFRLRSVAQPDSNTLQIDAIQVKVYHQAGGGGCGGGGVI